MVFFTNYIHRRRVPNVQGVMGHWQGEIERSLQGPLPRTGRQRHKVRKTKTLMNSSLSRAALCSTTRTFLWLTQALKYSTHRCSRRFIWKSRAWRYTSNMTRNTSLLFGSCPGTKYSETSLLRSVMGLRKRDDRCKIRKKTGHFNWNAGWLSKNGFPTRKR